MSVMELPFKIEVFEGPLDLLLSLISKNKVSIFDIPIALILDQYMEYLETMRKLDMDIAGEFITMAAELMLIKSKLLLPVKQEGEEEDPRADLAKMLLEYQKAKEAAEFLEGEYRKYSGRYAKDTDEIKPDKSIISEQDPKKLESAMQRVLSIKAALSRPVEQTFSALVTKKVVSVESKLVGIVKRLVKRGVSKFRALFDNAQSRSEIVATFIAVLELVKDGKVKVRETEDTSDPELYIEDN